MRRCRFLFACLAGLVVTVPLGGCPIPGDALGGLGGPAALGGGKITSIRTNLDPSKAVVAPRETITLWIDTNLSPSGLSYQWSATAGSLSSGSGQTVQWTAGGSGVAVVTCVVSSGEDTKSAQYRFTVR